MSAFADRSFFRSQSFAAERISGGELSVQPASLDLHLGDEFATFRPSESLVDVADESTYPTVDSISTSEFVLPAGTFALAHTDEYVELGRDVVGYLFGRSSVGRLGPFAHNAGLCDPGYEGQIVLELYNPAPYDVRFHEGMRIAQLVIHDLADDPRQSYTQKENTKYQDQTGVTPSRLYEDFE